MNAASSTVTDQALAATAFEFVLDVRGLNTMDKLAAATADTIGWLGMTAVASGMVTGPKAISRRPFHFTRWPQAWLSHYVANDFGSIDPLVRWARMSGIPLAWSDLLRLLPARDPGRAVMEAGQRFGFTEGMVVPMRSGDNAVGLFSVGGPRHTLSAAEQAFLTVVARASFEAGDRISRSRDPGVAQAVLSPRELECVVLVAAGNSDRKIGGALGITEPTVRFHLRNARDKLGADSRAHLAALAVAQGNVALADIDAAGATINS